MSALRHVYFRHGCRLDDFHPGPTHSPGDGNKKEESQAEEAKKGRKKSNRSIRKRRERCGVGSGTALPEGRTSNLGYNRVPLLVAPWTCRHVSGSHRWFDGNLLKNRLFYL